MEGNEGGVRAHAEPRFALQKFSAAKLAKLREEVLTEHGLTSTYLSAFEGAGAMQNYLNAYPNYPLLKGQQTNLYKCFLPLAWRLGSGTSVSAFLHPEGVYDDPKGGDLREELYKRLYCHFQFKNSLALFEGTNDHGNLIFSLNIYSGASSDLVDFYTVANLYSPATLDVSFEHGGEGEIPGIKDRNNKWDISGHSHRIVSVSVESLEFYKMLYESQDVPANQARLPVIHSIQIASVLGKFAEQKKRLRDLEGRYYVTEMWHETNSQKHGILVKETQFASSAWEWIATGPHFFVGRPFYKTPRKKCNTNADYDVLDLEYLSETYLPRSNFIPAIRRDNYFENVPYVILKENENKVTDLYRLILRGMLDPSGERTLISAIVPPGSAHVHSVKTLALKSKYDLLSLAGLTHTVVYDFFIRSAGVTGLYESILRQIPVLEVSSAIHSRVLLLNALTTHYADLWQECWYPAFTQDHWTKDDPRLPNDHFASLTEDWAWATPLRTDYARRQALVELDVLAAQALGLTLEELQTIYRVQFPVLRWNDRNTFYDQQGRIVYTVSKGLPGVGFSTKEWKDIKDMKSGTVEREIEDDTQPGGPVKRTLVYEAPFDDVDREADYATAWAAFEERAGS